MVLLTWGNPEIPILVVLVVGFALGYITGAKWWRG